MEQNLEQKPKVEKKKKEPNRTIEITASVSGVIPTGNYENYKPLYAVKEIMKNKQEIRWYPRGNKFYPSVTSIISAIEPINFDPDLLKQYASRGSIVHAQIEHYFKTGSWETDILQIPDTKLDYMIVKEGSLKLNWEDCKFLGFWEKYGKDFVPVDYQFGKVIELEKGQKPEEVVPPPLKDYTLEVECFNDEFLFAGRMDFPCKYKSVETLADFKTGAVYTPERLNKFWKQLSAYAKTIGNIKQLMIIPLNPKNKTGFGQPIIETDIDKYFNLFLQDRNAFKKIYGV